MDGSLSPKLDKEVTESELKSETETQASKRRWVVILFLFFNFLSFPFKSLCSKSIFS